MFYVFFVCHAFEKTEFVNAISPRVVVEKQVWYRWIGKVCRCATVFDFLCSSLGGATSELGIRKLRNFCFFLSAISGNNQPMK